MDEEIEIEFLDGVEEVLTTMDIPEHTVARIESAVNSGRTAHNLAPIRRGINFWEWVCYELSQGNTLLVQRGNTIREIRIRM